MDDKSLYDDKISQKIIDEEEVFEKINHVDKKLNDLSKDLNYIKNELSNINDYNRISSNKKY